MGALDAVIGALASLPWAVRCKFTVRRDGRWATVHRGGMQAVVREVGDGTVEVVYEYALHEVTRVRAVPEAAARLLLAVVQRDRLVRIEVPDAEPNAAAHGGA